MFLLNWICSSQDCFTQSDKPRDRLHVISSALSRLTGAPEEIHLVGQYQEQVSDLKNFLTHVEISWYPIILYSRGVGFPHQHRHRGPWQTVLRRRINLEEASYQGTSRDACDKASADSPPDGKLIKLPKLDIPTFNGNILHWLTFWEQFCITIHDRSDLSPAQKLVYLRQSLKDGSAKNVIEGLSHSGEQYDVHMHMRTQWLQNGVPTKP